MNNTDDEQLKLTNTTDEFIGIILSLVAGICSSIAWVCIRKMSSKCHYSIAPFYFSLGSTILGGLLYQINVQDTKSIMEYDFTTIVLLLIISLVTFTGQITLVLAYQYESAARVSVFSYLQTMLVMVYDASIFGTQIGASEIAGAILIIGCNFIIALCKFLNW